MSTKVELMFFSYHDHVSAALLKPTVNLSSTQDDREGLTWTTWHWARAV